MLRDVVRDAPGPAAEQVQYRVVAGLAGRGLVDAARQEDRELIVLATRATAGRVG
ncbi:MAG: hypothetical protein ACLP7J_02900 [Streptosporangiaceae bacterium]